MEKMTYKLTTRSSLIISPRANMALYKELGGFSLQKLNADYLEKSKLKVIYPFYQYGEYTEYAPERAEYYLPGTSVKGVLCQGASTPGDVMVDDVQVHNESIVLRNLYKAQYLDDEQKACFDVFFENVGLEMIKANAELKGEFYVRDRAFSETLFKEANKSTRIKLNQMLEYLLRKLEERKYSKELLDTFYTAMNKMSPLLEADDMFLLGGYKGLLHSMEIKDSQREIDGAVFLDRETMLPHGLVKVELIQTMG